MSHHKMFNFFSLSIRRISVDARIRFSLISKMTVLTLYTYCVYVCLTSPVYGIGHDFMYNKFKLNGFRKSLNAFNRMSLSVSKPKRSGFTWNLFRIFSTIFDL